MPNDDISRILKDWAYKAGRLNVRVAEAADGREVIQLRIELGIIQMELSGRPDGVLQDGFPSLLALFGSRGTQDGLEPDMCRRLREEGVQRSHRSAALFAIGRWKETIRDCNENLQLFDLCKYHANDKNDQEALEQFRGAVIALSARAAAEWAVEEDNISMAMAALEKGLEELSQILGEDWEQSNETQLLRGMKEALVPKLPRSERADLKERLAAAIENENYELAAILRDEIRLLRE
ncbi:MAG TPA: hypothetical protein EYO40_00570 [Phycisphaerales bacterium]|jgi:hypothetical protein|nr:hypothetical protein [Phycisphaerales bacterium]HIB49779.1 hypothetical protein [Phycisphaerales bacterium]HIN84721.1 hypothetical protein [Phycisphaerales bacterium]HIO19821.1 hypothetical protein [Phycisphaerales bacterium]